MIDCCCGTEKLAVGDTVLGTVAKRLYEGMFLIDTALAASDWDGIMSTIRKLLEKNEAEVVSLRKWDERRLAYDIQGKSRGTYILGYFRCDGGKVTGIERDAQLSEKIMRLLILKADDIAVEDMNKETPAMAVERQAAELAAGAAAQKTEETAPPAAPSAN
jgi:small subunit ribosomal protein S6